MKEKGSEGGGCGVAWVVVVIKGGFYKEDLIYCKGVCSSYS